MRIFILRHGHAEPLVSPDEVRQLTDKGRAETHQVLSTCCDSMSGLDAIYASPLIRAQQTAAIAASFFSALSIHTTPLLIPEATPSQVYEWLSSLEVSSVLLVSHQPLVGILVNQLCGSATGEYPMGTSSLAVIDADIPMPSLGKLLSLHHSQH